MPTAKVAFFSPPGERADFMISEAPDDVEIVLVDPSLSDDEQAALCRDVSAMITSKVSVDILKQCPNVKIIQTLSAGYDMLDLAAILEMGILVANNGGANAIAVSEHTIAMMISLSGNLWHQYDITMKQRQWKTGMDKYRVKEITDKTIGIVGMGRIGKQVAKRVQGFDARVQYYDLFPLSQEQERELDVTRVSLEELFRTSDIITCHTPLTSETLHIVNAENLGLMKSSAVLINTSRGPVVDEAALIEALQAGRIAGAGLDVFEQEPVDPNNPLLKMDNVVVSPHSAGTTWNTWFRRAEFAYRNMNGVWNGDAPMAVAQDYD